MYHQALILSRPSKNFYFEGNFGLKVRLGNIPVFCEVCKPGLFCYIGFLVYFLLKMLIKTDRYSIEFCIFIKMGLSFDS